MRNVAILVMSAFAPMLCFTARTESALLYSVNFATDELVRINSETGAVVAVGAIGHDMGQGALTFREGTLFALSSIPAPLPHVAYDLVAIDHRSGAKTSDVSITFNNASPRIADSLTSNLGRLLIGFRTDLNPFDGSIHADEIGELDPSTGVISNRQDFLSLGDVDFDTLATDSSGRLFSTNTVGVGPSNRQVNVYSVGGLPKEYKFLGSFGDGTENGSGMSFVDQNLFILDRGSGHIHTFDAAAGSLIKSTELAYTDSKSLAGFAPAPSLTLQAGDVNQDYRFDQDDLVEVFLANKYLTGRPATWGEGDWDGAPGGIQGDPPPGNGLFDQQDIIAALATGNYLTGPYAAIKLGCCIGDEQTSLVYDAGTGELRVDSPAGKNLTSINITSAGSKFIGDKPAVLDGAFDNFAADNIFKATFGGSFGDISFGNVLPAGISGADVAADLSAVGSLVGGGDLGAVDLCCIPEPSSLALLLMACLLIAPRRR